MKKAGFFSAAAAENKRQKNKMTKAQLETWGKENLGIDIDRRKAKAALVKQLLDASKWSNLQKKVLVKLNKY